MGGISSRAGAPLPSSDVFRERRTKSRLRLLKPQLPTARLGLSDAPGLVELPWRAIMVVCLCAAHTLHHMRIRIERGKSRERDMILVNQHIQPAAENQLLRLCRGKLHAEESVAEHAINRLIQKSCRVVYGCVL